MRHQLSIITLMAAALLLSCNKEAEPVRLPDSPSSGYYTEYTLSLEAPAEAPETKTYLPGTTSWENTVKQFTFFVFSESDGVLDAAAKVTSGSSASVRLRSARAPFRVYAVANVPTVGADAAPATESEMQSWAFTYATGDWSASTVSALSTNGMPMVGVGESQSGSTTITVNLRRLLAKIVLSVNHSGLDFENESVSVKNVPAFLRPFASSSSTGNTYSSGDYADISSDGTVNLKEGVIIYVPENKNGNLFTGNSDPKNKRLDNLSIANQGKVTYVEFAASKLNSSSGKNDGVSADVVYRFIPGSDNVSNCDVEGGKTYNIGLVLSWNGLFVSGDWKTDVDDLDDSRVISFVNVCSNPVAVGCATYYTVAYRPQGSSSTSYGVTSDYYRKDYGFSVGLESQINTWVSSGTLPSETGWTLSPEYYTVTCLSCNKTFLGFPAHLGYSDKDTREAWFGETCRLKNGNYCCPSCSALWINRSVTADNQYMWGTGSNPYGPGSSKNNMSVASSGNTTTLSLVKVSFPTSDPVVLVASTREGLHKATMTLYPQIFGEAKMEITDRPEIYVAQKATLRVSDVPLGVSPNVRLAVTSGSDIISLGSTTVSTSGGTVTLSARKFGTATITAYNGTSSTEIGHMNVTVKAPVIKGNDLTCDVTGTATSLTGHFHYESQSGATLSRGTDFDSTLYDQILALSYTKSGSNITISSGNVYISSVRTGGTIWTSFPSSSVGTVTASAAVPSALGSSSSKTINVYAQEYFTVDPTKRLDTIHDYSLLNYNYLSNYYQTEANKRSGSFDTDLIWGHTEWTVDNYWAATGSGHSDAITITGQFIYSSRRSVVNWSLSSDATLSHSGGRLMICYKATNIHSGDEMRFPIGYFDVYSHGAVGSRWTCDSENIDGTDMWYSSDYYCYWVYESSELAVRASSVDTDGWYEVKTLLSVSESSLGENKYRVFNKYVSSPVGADSHYAIPQRYYGLGRFNKCAHWSTTPGVPDEYRILHDNLVNHESTVKVSNKSSSSQTPQQSTECHIAINDEKDSSNHGYYVLHALSEICPSTNGHLYNYEMVP